MSDFFSPGWSVFIAIVTIVGIIWCLWLLMSQRKTKVPTDSSGNVTDTGHVWDDDLRELNNPLPRWWSSEVFIWLFIPAWAPIKVFWDTALKRSMINPCRLQIKTCNRFMPNTCR